MRWCGIWWFKYQCWNVNRETWPTIWSRDIDYTTIRDEFLMTKMTEGKAHSWNYHQPFPNTDRRLQSAWHLSLSLQTDTVHMNGTNNGQGRWGITVFEMYTTLGVDPPQSWSTGPAVRDRMTTRQRQWDDMRSLHEDSTAARGCMRAITVSLKHLPAPPPEGKRLDKTG